MHHRNRRRELCCGALALAVMLGVMGCTAPAPMGYMMPGPQRAGKVVVGVQAGAGGGTAVAGGTALHVEPFASRHTSIPITVAFVGGLGLDSGFMDESRTTRWYGQARFGVRHRFHKHWSLGTGLTPSMAYQDRSTNTGDETLTSEGLKGDLGLDFEWAYSRRFKYFGFTFGQRLTWNAISLYAVYLTNEGTFAFYGAKDAWAFTMTAGLGWGMPLVPWASVALGFVFFL